MEDMFLEAKVIQLGEIEYDLHKKVIDLEVQLKPSTPLDVIEARRKVVTEAAKKIEEAEELCAKEVEQVS